MGRNVDVAAVVEHTPVEVALAEPAAPDPTPTVSLIIVNYNGGKYLAQCLDSLAKGADTIHELIIVDNASTDGSADHLDRLAFSLTFIRSSINLGFGGGNNLGARHATGEYLAFLNPDTTVESGWLTSLASALAADGQAGLATPQILLLSEPESINTCGNDVHISGLTLCRGMGTKRNTSAPQATVGAISGAAFIIRSDLFRAIGGFDEMFFMYMEDTDLSLRCRLMGYRCLFVPASIVYHDYVLRFGPKKTFYQERNRYLTLLKSLRWGTLMVLLPALTLAEIVTWGFTLLRDRKRLRNKTVAYLWVARHWQDIMGSRRHTQATRTVRDRTLLEGCTHRLAFELTGPGWVASVAHVVFDSLFLVLKQAALTVIWW